MLLAQKPDGIPFIKNYSPNEYGQSTDNWAIAQDKRGVMYFGNASGVLEYDGNTWSLITVSNSSLVRSIAISDEGIIYVGAVGEFGYISPDQKGKMEYHTLLDKLPENEKDFADVWKTYVGQDGVYFQTFSKLIRVKDNHVKIWKPTTSFHFSFYINGVLYINERGQGLKQLINDSLVLIKGGEVFKDIRIYAMLPYAQKQILIATREKGLMFLDKKADENHLFRQWNIEANDELIEAQIYGGTTLADNSYAFATLQSGIVFMDDQGKITRILNKQSGLRDDIINYLAPDNQNDLWVALGNGLAHIEVSSPLSTLGDAQGLHGSVQDITKFKGTLYVATSLGVFGAVNDYFVQVKGINSQSWALKSFYTKTDTLLIASTESGIVEIDKFNSRLIQEGFSYNLWQSTLNPERLFIANPDGLSSLKYENRKWIYEDYINGIDNEIRSITEDKQHNLWLGTPFDGVIKLDFNTKTLSKETPKTTWGKAYTIQHYDTTNKLPDMQYNIPCLFKGNIVFATSKGIYKFNPEKSVFYPSGFLNKDLTNTQVYRFVPKDSSFIWMFMVKPDKFKEVGVVSIENNGNYSLYSQPFLKIFEREIHAIFPDNNTLTWLGGPDGIVRYDAKKKKNFSIPFFALIRKVYIGKDSVIFGGNYLPSKNGGIISYKQSDTAIPEVKYSYNSFMFEFSATSFGMEEKMVYNFFLEGHDTEWSGWLTKINKEYTDLSEGQYTFHVKAKNIYDTESIESTYTFTILPPWYRTVWAYIGYVVLVIGIIYSIIRISVRRLVKAKNQLEKVVKERTAEVVAQKHLIEEKHKEITDSINYAERIQRSFLATKDMLDENLKDYFVFFKPKDVVSGDFFWAAKHNNWFYLVTADSTGHGVPGAIMSLLNITSLEKAIEQYHNPADVLNYTRTNIIERLKKDGSKEGGKDGMDCSLCTYDFENKKLYVTAANNPVWIVRSVASSVDEGDVPGSDAGEGSRHEQNSTHTDINVIEIKPDKMPVGKHDKQDIPFSQHEIDLKPGDVVYTLTDGFPDQFGGEKGKKFMSKNLRELLAANAHLPMPEQKKLLQTTFANWVGSLEQIDDVTIIGVRIR